ncbi:hypothetical protein AB1L42_05290 [Thalassoglobus sp. JC818]|uniref:hypothetical protein n=1 Tax=Thalassoglobus sp. JC818 TaxID=3232136 RepID=UPI00345A9D9D
MNKQRTLALLTACLLTLSADSAIADFILPIPPTPTYVLDATTTTNVVGFVNQFVDFSDTNPSTRDARRFKKSARRSVLQLMRSFRRSDWYGPLVDELLALLDSNNLDQDAQSLLAKLIPPSLPSNIGTPIGSSGQNGPVGGLVLGSGQSDSSIVVGGSTANATSAPEPGSMVLWATATLTGLTVLRRRSNPKSI